jgi:hypothetical protein
MAIKHTYRKNGAGGLQTAMLTPIKAARQMCIECMGFQVREVTDRTSTLCPLHPFRQGRAHTPGRSHKNRSKKGTPGAVSGAQINERQAGHR